MYRSLINFLTVILFTVSGAFAQSSHGGSGGATDTSGFIIGGDFSFLQQEEAGGAQFSDNGITGDPMAIARSHGWNLVRLRIWHTPTDSINDLAHTLAMARRVKSLGMKFLLDFHYSDWWADPGKQNKPAAWTSLTTVELAESVRAYTRSVLTAFHNEGLSPDMIQPGNEISCGMLWPDGSVCSGNDDATHWANLGNFLRAAIAGIHDVLPAESIRVMIHSDRGGDYAAASWFFDHLANLNIPFDDIGLSYYPWWHGDFSHLSDNVTKLENRYHKDIVIAETSYPWTLGWADGESNIVGDSNQLMAGYPASPAGQNAYLAQLNQIVRSIPNGHGIGVMYWEPDWVSAPSFWSGGENLALFDFSGKALPGIDAFTQQSVPVSFTEGWNQISLPVSTDSASVESLFPQHLSAAYTFNGTYQKTTTLQNGTGYWLKSPAVVIPLTGWPRFTDTISVHAGWNMIGSLSVSTPVSLLLQSPPANILTPFYGYATGYTQADTLRPCSGYWVKVTNPGSIIIPVH